jgi:hypothetical protein
MLLLHKASRLCKLNLFMIMLDSPLFWRIKRCFQRQLLRNRVRFEIMTGTFSWDKYTHESLNILNED